MVADDSECDKAVGLAFLKGRVMAFTDFLTVILTEDAFEESLDSVDLDEDFEEDFVERRSGSFAIVEKNEALTTAYLQASVKYSRIGNCIKPIAERRGALGAEECSKPRGVKSLDLCK